MYGQIDCSQAIKIDCEYVVKTTEQLTSKISYFNNEAYHTNELLEIEGKGQILELFAQNIYTSSLDIL
ncbi:MAG: hypothetical protein KDC90_12415, partial [Ignavibacteriae bacterium]|nr:hypothetical protein [Ignavibacteriota bacterium]